MTTDLNNASDTSRFINLAYGAIGRTASTRFEPTTSSKFLFWMAERGETHQRLTLEIGNIVVARADDGSDLTFGTVVEMRSYSDVDSFIADYLSHNFGDADIQVPTDISEVVVVTCNVMRNLSGETRPLGRSQAFFPSRLGIEFSYGIVDERGESLYLGAPIPIGIFENGDGTIAPISVDENFVVGPEGAHLNVSGISGLASKTSAVQFILKSLQAHTRKRIAIVMFNVKSRDLLYIDRANPRLATEQWSQRAYEAIGVPMSPFAAPRFFAPQNPSVPAATLSLRTQNVEAFSWDLTMIRDSIPNMFDAMDWDDKMEGLWYTIREQIERRNIVAYTQMLTFIEQTVQNVPQGNMWALNHHVATWQKMRARLQGLPRTFRGLIRTAGQGRDLPWNDLQSGSVFVIDIQMLQDKGKKLVFGRAMSEIDAMMESEDKNLDAVVVFVDELNKYAPSGNVRTPIKHTLIDITARGRGRGVVLFGAEQFASTVDREVIENSSTYLFGRTESNELRHPNYTTFSDEVKTKLTTLPQGQLLARFAKFAQPIFLKFPFPPCLPGDQYQPPGEA